MFISANNTNHAMHGDKVKVFDATGRNLESFDVQGNTVAYVSKGFVIITIHGKSGKVVILR